MAYKLAKTKRIPLEPGESWSPTPEPEVDTGVKTAPGKTSRLPEGPLRTPFQMATQDYPLAESQRRRQRSMDQMGGEGPFLENPGPQTARDQLAGIIGENTMSGLEWVPPIWAMDLADRANFARMRGDYGLEHGLAGQGIEAGLNALLTRYGGKMLKWGKDNPEAVAIGAFRAGDAYSREND